ncbi:MAG: ABC transporter ATP-binding protein [Clostridia bacterium]|nr:ABC transporter ATP-binding protein [Clostridia bacterium]
MALLSCLNVTKYFGENRVLNDVSLEIERGSFVSIIGASGSGKSTLLTILGGIDKPTEGKVLLDGAEISTMSEKELAILRRTKLGFVFQFFNLAPYLTAEENVLLPIMLSGKVKDEDRQRANELMEYLGISELKNKLPGKMSGGEQQRIAIARGLIINPEVILLDEPTGNLDSKNSEEIMNLLKRINKEFNTTIVQVTHSDINARYGNVIITIKDGKIIRSDISAIDSLGVVEEAEFVGEDTLTLENEQESEE